MNPNDYHLEQSTPAFFIQGPSLFARFVFLAILSIALIVTDSRLQYLKGFRAQLETYLHPIALLANGPVELYTKVDQYFTSHHQLLSENKVLRSKLLKANVDVQSVRTLTLENTNLRRLVQLDKRLTQKQMLAEILHASSDQFSKEVVINRGKAHQVKLGAAVIDASGVVGQVTRLYPQTSLVTLLTNKSMEIPVMVERNGLRAIAFGHGQSRWLEIPYLPANIDIKEGDKLVTSGIDFVYPAGYAVGTVEKISVSPGSAFIRILCAVAGGVDLHRHVLVVNPSEQEAALPEEKDNADADEAQSEEKVKEKAKSYMSQGVIHVPD